MSIVWKIIRITGLYVIFFFVSVIFSAVALDGLPDALEAHFALLSPVLLIIWYEKRRTKKIAAKKTSADSGAGLRRALPLRGHEAHNPATARRQADDDTASPLDTSVPANIPESAAVVANDIASTGVAMTPPDSLGKSSRTSRIWRSTRLKLSMSHSAAGVMAALSTMAEQIDR